MRHINKKQFFLLIFILLIYLAGIYMRGNSSKDYVPQLELSFRQQPLEFTRHAICRMECREISETDVRNILLNGVIDQSRSKADDQPCPSFALNGRKENGNMVRVVFADCDSVTRVVTTIDLAEDFDCPKC